MPLVYKLENWVKGLTPGHRVTHSRSQARASVSGLPIWYSLPSYFLLAVDHELVSLMKRIPFDTTHWLPRVLQMWPSIEWTNSDHRVPFWNFWKDMDLSFRDGSEDQWRATRRVIIEFGTKNELFHLKQLTIWNHLLGVSNPPRRWNSKFCNDKDGEWKKNEVWISEVLTQGQSGSPLKAAKSRTGGKRTLVQFKD